MRRTRVALATALVLLAACLGLVLSEGPPAVLASDGVGQEEPLGVLRSGVRICQSGETIPRGTSAVRVWFGAFTGPSVTAEVRSTGGVVSSGQHGSGWDGRSVTVAVRRVERTVSPAEVCFSAGPGESVAVFGAPTSAGSAKRTAGRARVEYLGDASGSWLARAGGVAERMGLGRAWSGRWVALFVLALMLAAAVTASWLALGELRG